MKRRNFLKYTVAGGASMMTSSLLTAAPVLAQGPLSITDDRGAVVSIPGTPEHIASISYFATDVALALGLMPVATTYMVADRHPDFLLGLTAKMK